MTSVTNINPSADSLHTKDSNTCIECQSKKATLKCMHCQASICKNCCHFLSVAEYSLDPHLINFLEGFASKTDLMDISNVSNNRNLNTKNKQNNLSELHFERRESFNFCNSCYQQNLIEKIEKYNQDVENVKNLGIFFKSQSKETRLLSRKEKTLKIENGLDEADIQMKLAYLAYKMGFNCVIDVEIQVKKIRQGSYQTSLYIGTGIPSHVSEKKLIKDRSNWSNPN